MSCFYETCGYNSSPLDSSIINGEYARILNEAFLVTLSNITAEEFSMTGEGNALMCVCVYIYTICGPSAVARVILLGISFLKCYEFLTKQRLKLRKFR
jgi:hypothetical protein